MAWKTIKVKDIKALESIKLPSKKWSVIRAEITFERDGCLGDWAQVVYDGMNDVFYVKTNKCIVYSGDEGPLQEALKLMNIANRIIKKK